MFRHSCFMIRQRIPVSSETSFTELLSWSMKDRVMFINCLVTIFLMLSTQKQHPTNEPLTATLRSSPARNLFCNKETSSVSLPTMSGFGNWQTGHGPSQQSWTSDDGNTHVSYSSQSYSWSSSSQGNCSGQNNALLPAQSAPRMLPMPMPDLNQIHQQHMDLHRSSMQSAMQMHQNMVQNVMPPTHQPALMPAMHHQTQTYAQIEHAPMYAPQLQGPPRNQRRIRAVEEDSSDNEGK